MQRINHGRKFACGRDGRRLNAARRGFTLAELAIVMGVASLVLGTVWIVAGIVWDNYRIYRLNQQIVTIVQNIRSYYDTTSGAIAPGSAAGSDITTVVDTANLLPTDMRENPLAVGGNINHSLSALPGAGAGSFHIMKVNDFTLRVRLLGLKQDRCARVLMQFPALTLEVGAARLGTNFGALSYADVVMTDIANPGYQVGAAVPNLLPLRLVTANAWCAGVGATNEVDLDFKLHN